MAGPNYVGMDKGYLAESALTQFRAVTFGTAADSCAAIDNTADEVLGFVQESVATADANLRLVNVRLEGSTMAIAGGSISKGAYLKTDNTGKLVATTTNNDKYVARAEMDASANDQFVVKIQRGFYGA